MSLCRRCRSCKSRFFAFNRRYFSSHFVSLNQVQFQLKELSYGLRNREVGGRAPTMATARATLWRVMMQTRTLSFPRFNAPRERSQDGKREERERHVATLLALYLFSIRLHSCSAVSNRIVWNDYPWSTCIFLHVTHQWRFPTNSDLQKGTRGIAVIHQESQPLLNKKLS